MSEHVILRSGAPPPGFDIRLEYAYFRISPLPSFPRLIDEVKHAIRYSRECEIDKLLIDGLDVTGIAPLSFFDRFWLAEVAAAESLGKVRIAFVFNGDFVDPHKFLMVVAQRRELVAEVFQTTDEAQRWVQNL